MKQQDFEANENLDLAENDFIDLADQEIAVINRSVTVDAFFVHSFAQLRERENITKEMI